MTFHHIGFVVKAIEPCARKFASSVMAEWDGVVIDDPLQVARVAFLYPQLPGMPVIELVEPLNSQSTVSKFLAKGGGLHHLCYEVESLDDQLQRSTAEGHIVVREPLPAVAFNQRRIAWVYTRQKLLIEYLESAKPA